MSSSHPEVTTKRDDQRIKFAALRQKKKTLREKENPDKFGIKVQN